MVQSPTAQNGIALLWPMASAELTGTNPDVSEELITVVAVDADMNLGNQPLLDPSPSDDRLRLTWW